MATSKKQALIGSGHVYVKQVDADAVDLSDMDSIISTYFVTANQWGNVKNGATITYTPTNTTISDDLGEWKRTKLTAEDLTFTPNTMTITNDMLTDMITTATSDEDSAGGLHVVKIGGLSNVKKSTFFVGFHHNDPEDGDFYFGMVGTPTGELSIAFTPDDASVISPTFTASNIDDKGTLAFITLKDPAGE